MSGSNAVWRRAHWKRIRRGAPLKKEKGNGGGGAVGYKQATTSVVGPDGWPGLFV
jgi:hypothetical protein